MQSDGGQTSGSKSIEPAPESPPDGERAFSEKVVPDVRALKNALEEVMREYPGLFTTRFSGDKERTCQIRYPGGIIYNLVHVGRVHVFIPNVPKRLEEGLRSRLESIDRKKARTRRYPWFSTDAPGIQDELVRTFRWLAGELHRDPTAVKNDGT